MWINSNTLVVYNLISEIRLAFPEYSFPEYPTATDFEVVNVYPVIQTPQPSYNPITQAVEQLTPVETEGQWYQVWVVVDLSPEQIAYNEDQAKAANKAQATTLLQQTDWTAPTSIADPADSNPYLANRQEFLAYRSQVREIALNPPVVVQQWPVMPEEQWATS